MTAKFGTLCVMDNINDLTYPYYHQQKNRVLLYVEYQFICESVFLSLNLRNINSGSMKHKDIIEIFNNPIN